MKERRDTKKYKVIEPFINRKATLKSISLQSGLPLRTLTSWVKKHRTNGLIGLIRQPRNDKGAPRKYTSDLPNIIEGFYPSQPQSRSSNIYRLIYEYSSQMSVSPPRYKNICNINSKIPNDLAVLSHEGTKVYQHKYDLLNIRKSEKQNAIWQAVHVFIDIKILNERNKLQNPWLTIIIDDCSRAICGYEFSFLSPSAHKTSLCLRHAI